MSAEAVYFGDFTLAIECILFWDLGQDWFEKEATFSGRSTRKVVPGDDHFGAVVSACSVSSMDISYATAYKRIRVEPGDDMLRKLK